MQMPGSPKIPFLLSACTNTQCLEHMQHVQQELKAYSLLHQDQRLNADVQCFLRVYGDECRYATSHTHNKTTG